MNESHLVTPDEVHTIVARDILFACSVIIASSIFCEQCARDCFLLAEFILIDMSQSSHDIMAKAIGENTTLSNKDKANMIEPQIRSLLKDFLVDGSSMGVQEFKKCTLQFL